MSEHYYKLIDFIKQYIRRGEEIRIMNKWLTYNFDTGVVSIHDEKQDELESLCFWMMKGNLTEFVDQKLIDGFRGEMDEQYGL